MTIDINKQYRTRDGREARIYAVEPGGPDPVHGAFFEDGFWHSSCWDADGSYWPGGKTRLDLDLIEVKPQRYVWLNVYPDEAWCHNTREKADKADVETRTHRIRVLIPDEPVWDE